MNAQDIVSRVVRIYMVARDQTQEELAAQLGLSRPAVTQKLSGRSKWTISDLEKLQGIYGVTAQELLEGRVLEALGGVVTRDRKGLPTGPRSRRSA